MGEIQLPRSLSIVLASDCNLRCAYCYQNAKRPGRIGWADLREALRMVMDSGAPSVRLIFTGGEPLLEFGLLRRAVRYVESRRPKRLGVQYELCTNGLLLGRREARFLDRYRFVVQLSFDGVEEAQNLRGAGTFLVLDRLLTRLRREQSARFANHLQIAAVVTPETVQYLARSVDYFLGRGIRDIAVEPVVARSDGWRPSRIRELDRQFARVFESCLRLYRRTGRVPLQLFRRDAGWVPPRPTGRRLCGVGAEQSLAIGVDGGLSGCLALVRSYIRFPANSLGRSLARLPVCRVTAPRPSDWLTRYQAAIDAIPAFGGRRSKFSGYGRCATCRSAAECHICPMAIVLAPGPGSPHRVPDFVCAFNRVRARYRRRFPRQRSIGGARRARPRTAGRRTGPSSG